MTGGSSWVETAPLSMLRHNNCCSAALCSGSVNTTHSDQSLSCPESAPLNTEYIHQMLSYCNERCRHVHRICTEAAALLGLLSVAAQWAGGESHQTRARGKKCDSVTIAADICTADTARPPRWECLVVPLQWRVHTIIHSQCRYCRCLQMDDNK